ncbi:iron uptake system component EfeO [Leifsonia sp. 98AMF]|uniref:EfeM/EfeO family lipoprotein n=1 Tax=unclassified Leifsonia TaxID=2663824 RepID=UPI00087A28D1|nr:MULTISPECIES: EfeM/EfeO family lipoprotein [unclassified Leifsonia]SDH74764.1 iron uptake system component EfeO [Leifsonia sp. 197AMF]SDJ47217.1 iron uptake system component EfeO [Leifsonia sp. 466MF]SDK28228.1 iron uptake system component EfeO [Leifsonia sp. 157MF]SDN67124.1 iron uptake system component EfeO [Leifsonia sp. 509MF]SEN41278.1 iron uptake system component EfeO [Leifsonia sp. 467MF]
MSTRARLAAFFAALGALVVVATILTIALRPVAVAPNAPDAFDITAGMDDCGRGWGESGAPSGAAASGLTVHGGDQTFTVTNTTVGGIEVYVQAVDSKRVYLDLESIGAGAHATARVTLGAGRYRFVCLPADADPVHGPVVTVGKAPPGSPLTPGIVPVTRNDLIPVAKAYTTWVASRLPALRQQVAAVAADAEEGDLPAARSDWLTAHTTYETLGAAYDAFGELGDQLDGLPRTDPTGFHLVESQLWRGDAAATVAASAHDLLALVDRLQTEFAGVQLDPGDVALRAHEIVEDAIQDTLTGATDAGSGTSLASVDAELTGAEQALAPLEPVLTGRYEQLGDSRAALTAAHAVVEAHRAPDGTWTPLDQLSRTDREHVDAALDRAAELLAPVAAICDPRRDS